MSDSENGKGDNETTQPDVKEEDNEDQKDSTDSKQEEKPTNEEKKPKKTTKKEDVKDDDDDDEDDDEGSDESEEEVGLLDRPVEVSGSRERKKVERLEVNFKTHTNKAEIPEGRGEKLGDCPRIEFKIQKTAVEELKALHKLLFNRPGSAHEIKKNIRKFSGFSFVEGSAEFEKKKSALEKQKMGVLKQMCEVLDIERSGVREDIASRIVQFLLEPKSSGKQVPVAKPRKRSSTKGGRPKRTEKEKKSKKGSAKKRKKASDSDEEASDESAEKEEDAVDEEEEEDVAADESDESFEEPKKKKKSKPRKKKETVAKEKKKEKNGEKSKKSEDKKTPAKAAKRKSVGSSDDSDDESSDGEPLAKKVKSPPSDDEIKKLVKTILDDADLEEITMKKVIKQVFDTYPDFDLSEKKEYIKATVKSVIS